MYSISRKVKSALSKVKPSELWRQKAFRPYIIKKNIEGVTFDFLIGDLDGMDWYDLSSTDPEWLEMRFIKEHIVRPGDIIFECGGHHGCTAILLSTWVGNEGKVATFEPNPKNVEIIEKNVSLNGLKNVLVEQKAVGSSNGNLIVSYVSNSSVIPDNVVMNGVEVSVISLDSYAELSNLNPTFLTIDVEGYEVEVLKGAKNVLQRTPKLAIEIHTEVLAKYLTSVTELLDLLDLNRYHSWIQWDDREMPVIFTGQQISKRVHLFAISRSDL